MRLGPLLTLRLVHNSGIGLLVLSTEDRATHDESVPYDRSDTTRRRHEADAMAVRGPLATLDFD